MKKSSLLLGLGALVCALEGASCAKGDAFTGGGDGGSSGVGNTTSGDTTTSGGGGASSTTTGSTTGVTTGSTTTSSSTGPACSEMPCKLVEPQCGCAPGEMCSVDTSGRSCVPEGSVGWGEICGAGAQCAPGHICVLTKDTPPTISTCSKFCASDADCEAPGGLCIITLNDGNGGSIPDVTLCTDNCEPTTNAGCAAGTACQIGTENGGLMRTVTFCAGAGAGTQNTTCADSTECAATYGCFGGVNACLHWCKVGLGGCPAATLCNSLSPPLVLGGTEYGACL